MGKIIFNFNKRILTPFVYIKRRIDAMETQELRITLSENAILGTETGNQITLHGEDEDHNRVEVEIPISIEDLKKALACLENNA